jgi:hypothetical protein
MKRAVSMALVIVCCGLAISACKKKGPKTATAQMAADTTALRKQVKKVVKNKVRREKVMLLVGDIDRTRGQLTLAFFDMQKKIRKDPHIPRADLEALIAEFVVVRVDAMKALANARFEMRQHITEKEWKKLFPPPKKKMDKDKAAEETSEEAAEQATAETAPASADEAVEQPGDGSEQPESEE